MRVKCDLFQLMIPDWIEFDDARNQNHYLCIYSYTTGFCATVTFTWPKKHSAAPTYVIRANAAIVQRLPYIRKSFAVGFIPRCGIVRGFDRRKVH